VAYPGGLGEHNARDTLSPQPAAYPYAAAHSSASSIAPPAIGTERNVSAGRCGTVPGGCAGQSRVAEGLRLGRARAAQAARVPGVATPPMAQWLEPAGANEQPVPPSTVHGACMPPERGHSIAHRRPDGTTAPEPGAAARGRVLLVCLRWGINSGIIVALCEEAKTAPRRCPWDLGRSQRTVRPPQDRPACTSRASSCLGGWAVSNAGGTSPVRHSFWL